VTIRGFVDTYGRIFYPWSIEALLNLSNTRVYLEHDEIQKFVITQETLDKIRVIGQPLPAFFPIMVKEFGEKIIGENQAQKLRMVNKYSVFDG
jgi:hypothetical protein